MVITIVSAGPRPNGATAKTLREIENYLGQKDGVTIKYFDLAKYNMRFCTGCCQCDLTGECSIINDGIEDTLNEIRNSDGIIFGCPTYVGSVTGQLKTFFDRAHLFLMEQTLRGKYGFSVSTYETATGRRAISQMDYFLLICGASRKGNFTLKLPVDSDPFEKEDTKDILHKKVEGFYRCIKSKAKRSLFEYLFSIILVDYILKPFYRKDPKKYGRILKLFENKKI